MKPEKVFLRTQYNYDTNAASKAGALACLDESRTQQSFTEECDINTIVRRFNLTGTLPVAARAPTYGDFSEVMDYQTALNAIIAAEDSFMTLPAEIRKKFNNDAGAFVDFCSDEANRAELEKMGMITPQAMAEVMATPQNKTEHQKGVSQTSYNKGETGQDAKAENKPT